MSSTESTESVESGRRRTNSGVYLDCFAEKEEGVGVREERQAEVRDSKRGRVDSVAELAEDMREVRSELKEVLRAIDSLRLGVNSVLQRMDKQEEKIECLSEKIERQGEEMRGMRKEVEKSAEEMEQVKEKVKRSMETVTEVKKGVDEWKDRVSVLEERMIDQEARGRRNNLLFHGVEESEREDCLKVATDFIKEKCRVSTNVVIERAHRLGRKRPGTHIGARASKPRPLIVRFLDFNHRQQVKDGRKHLPAGVSISEDLPLEIREARKRLTPEMMEAKRNGLDAWIAYPARLIVGGNQVRVIRPGEMVQATGAPRA